MNPDPMILAYMRDRDDREQAERRAHRDSLHKSAVARRRKAKRGGRR